MRLLVTGGCGFIGSAFVRRALASPEVERLVNVDALTYSGRLVNCAEAALDERYRFVEADLVQQDAVERVFREERPTAVVHFAAESHVDRSILGALQFVDTNVRGTACLLEASRTLARSGGPEVRFVQVSTDEVYGDLGSSGGRFREDSPLDPRNPYSATKASADLLVLAWARTHGLSAVVTRASNNYGPRQFPEKLIPLMITNALDDRPLPVYGDGENVRDWLWVEDHCEGVWRALTRGRAGQVYNLGGDGERENLRVVETILAALGKPESLIRFVKDRPGHDRRYAIDFSKAREELGFAPRLTFEEGLRRTVDWYRANETWWRPLKDTAFRRYCREVYGHL